ncbi:MAG: molybdenum cofactor synthesis domain-containing protein [Promethearchaeota archaeon]
MNEKRFLEAVMVDKFEKILDSITFSMDEVVSVPVKSAINRVLAKDLKTTIPIPPFHKSKVDGYAVIAEDVFKASEEDPVTLEIIGVVEIGKNVELQIKKGQCMYVPTGGMIPDGADAMVKIEYTKTQGNMIDVFSPLSPGENILFAGADLQAGATFLKEGDKLTIPRLGCISAAGITEVEVFRTLKVGVFSSGNELTVPGKPLHRGKIYDVNSTTIISVLEDIQMDVEYRGIIPDNYSRLSRTINELSREVDVIICSGGTSKGKGDHLPSIIEKLPTLETFIHGVRIKPGKPLIFAKTKSVIMFVLPGNPTSALMILNRLVIPYLRKWSRLPSPPSKKVLARLDSRVYSEFGRRELKAVILYQADDDSFLASPVQKGSETISTLKDANGYFEIPENEELIPENSQVHVTLF